MGTHFVVALFLMLFFNEFVMSLEIYQNSKLLRQKKIISYKKMVFSVYGVETVNSSEKVPLQFCILSKASIDGYFILVT